MFVFVSQNKYGYEYTGIWSVSDLVLGWGLNDDDNNNSKYAH